MTKTEYKNNWNEISRQVLKNADFISEKKTISRPHCTFTVLEAVYDLKIVTIVISDTTIFTGRVSRTRFEDEDGNIYSEKTGSAYNTSADLYPFSDKDKEIAEFLVNSNFKREMELPFEYNNSIAVVLAYNNFSYQYEKIRNNEKVAYWLYGICCNCFGGENVKSDLSEQEYRAFLKQGYTVAEPVAEVKTAEPIVEVAFTEPVTEVAEVAEVAEIEIDYNIECEKLGIISIDEIAEGSEFLADLIRRNVKDGKIDDILSMKKDYDWIAA